MTTFTTIEDRTLQTVTGGTGTAQQTVQQVIANEMAGATEDIDFVTVQQMQQYGPAELVAKQ